MNRPNRIRATGVSPLTVIGFLVVQGCILGCTMAPCREVKSNANASLVGPQTTESAPSQPVKPVSKSKTVLVFKYDGSRQCGEGNVIPIEQMAKDLSNIKILNQSTRNDGMMRTQVCGAGTGQAHVFEINAPDLEKAISNGFKQWNFGQN